MSSDVLLRGVAVAADEETLWAQGGAVRVIAVDATEVAREARVRHGVAERGAELAAQGVVAACLLSAHIKGEERVTLQVQGERPRLAFFGEVDAEGAVRARITPAHVKSAPQGRISGVMMAIKSDGSKEMYRGMTEITDQTLEQALEHHLVTSSQVDAVLRIETRMQDGQVSDAVGVLIERLPSAPDKPSMDASTFHARYRGLPPGEAVALVRGLQNRRLLEEPFQVLAIRGLDWRCRCSQEKVEGTLAALGSALLLRMADEDHGAEVTCHFCNEVYQVDEGQLRAFAQG